MVPLIDLTPPTATVKAEDVTVAGGTVGSVTVRYEDDVQLAATAGLNPNGVTVTGPTGDALQVLGATAVRDDGGPGSDDTNKPASKLLVTYSFVVPGGSWDAADNGTYTVAVASGAVADAAGNAVGPAAGSFKVQVAPAPPPDAAAPTAPVAAPDPITTAGGATATVTVKYEDGTAVSAASIDKGDVAVTGPDGKPLTVASVVTNLSADGTAAVATYTVEAPGGTWDAVDNGTYTVALGGGAVTDAAGNGVAAGSATFKVNVAAPEPPPAPVAPVATLSPVASIAAAGGTTQTVTVTYAADGLVDAGTVGVADVVVAGPSGAPLAVTGVRVEPQASGAKLTAVYTVAAPGGAWDSADNGAYAVAVVAGEVKDAAGYGTAAAVASTFNVAVPIPAPVVDTKFSGGTPVNTGFVAEATAATADGKLLVIGRQGDLAAGSSQYVVKRLNADGSLDASFGTAGVVVSTVGGNAAAFAVAVGADGSVYLAGSKGGALAVWKFKASGAPDNKFGTKGEAAVDAGGGEDRAYGLTLGPDGSVVAVGRAGDQWAIVKLTAGGVGDGGFGTGGLIVGSTSAPSVLSGVTVNADGTIVAGGSIGDKLAVYKFLPTGAADTRFTGNGRYLVPGLVTRTDLNGPDYTVGVGVQADGKILVTGQSLGNFAVARITPTGDLDLSFADGGIAKVDLGGDDDADQVLLQGTGQILVIGTTEVAGQTPRLGIAALTADGALNTAFGTGGTATVDAGLGGGGRALHIGDLVVRAFGSAQQNGQVVVGTGQASASPTPLVNSGLRRLNVPGSGLLGSFGAVNGANRKLSFVDADGTKVTLTLKGGSGKALYDGSKVDVILTGTGDGSSLTVATKGGDGKVFIRNLSTDGGLKAISAKGAVISGAFTVNGRLAKGDVSGLEGTLAAAGGIGTLLVRGDLKNAVVLGGASLGSDNKVGGTGAAADSYAAAPIGTLKVGGAIRSSVVGAGLRTTNATLLDDDDTVVDPTASVLGTLTAKGGLDAASRVVAGKVGKAKVPGLIDTTVDSRFEVSAV